MTRPGATAGGAAGARAAWRCAAAGRRAAWGPVGRTRPSPRGDRDAAQGPAAFYKDHRLEIPTLSLEADLPPRRAPSAASPRPRDAVPVRGRPRTEAAFKAQVDEAGQGRPPALAGPRVLRAPGGGLQGRDKERILAESDVLAGLVTDLHNPLALTDNADGQKTGQHGLWMRFSARLPGGVEQATSKLTRTPRTSSTSPTIRLLHDQRHLRLAGQPPLRGGAGPARASRATGRSTTRTWRRGRASSCATASAGPPATWAATGTRPGRRPAGPS